MTENPRDDEPDLLFVYGTLGPTGLGQLLRCVWEADAVRGQLYDLGPYPALIDPGNPQAGWVEGHTRPVTAVELAEVLDPYEGVDEGLYRRLPLTTRSGRRAWVYAYTRPLPQWANGPLDRWRASSSVPDDDSERTHRG